MKDELNKVFNKSVTQNRDKRNYRTGSHNNELSNNPRCSSNISSSKTPPKGYGNPKNVNESFNSVGTESENTRYKRFSNKLKEDKTNELNARNKYQRIITEPVKSYSLRNPKEMNVPPYSKKPRNSLRPEPMMQLNRKGKP